MVEWRQWRGGWKVILAHQEDVVNNHIASWVKEWLLSSLPNPVQLRDITDGIESFQCGMILTGSSKGELPLIEVSWSDYARLILVRWK